MGLAFAVVPLVAALVIVWPSTMRSAATGVSLDGTCLLEVTSLDTSGVAARLADAGGLGPMMRRRAGMFMVAVVDGQLVPVDKKEDDGARLTWFMGDKTGQSERTGSCSQCVAYWAAILHLRECITHYNVIILNTRIQGSVFFRGIICTYLAQRPACRMQGYTCGHRYVPARS
jgi:hypothetical protein